MRAERGAVRHGELGATSPATHTLTPCLCCSYIMHAQTFLDEEHILADLSPPLRREVGVHLNSQLLTQVPVLKSADPAFQAAIVSMLRPTVVLIDEYIICAGDIGYEMYILRIGAVGVLGTNGRQLYTLSDGSFFGEVRSRAAAVPYRLGQAYQSAHCFWRGVAPRTNCCTGNAPRTRSVRVTTARCTACIASRSET